MKFALTFAVATILIVNISCSDYKVNVCQLDSTGNWTTRVSTPCGISDLFDEGAVLPGYKVDQCHFLNRNCKLRQDPDACGRNTPCVNGACAVTASFKDTFKDDVPDKWLYNFFSQNSPMPKSWWIYVEIDSHNENARAICSARADWYIKHYLEDTMVLGSGFSGKTGTWPKYYKALSDAEWTGPDNSKLVNSWGNQCYGQTSWCAQHEIMFSPNRGANGSGESWAANSINYGQTVKIQLGATREAACGF